MMRLLFVWVLLGVACAPHHPMLSAGLEKAYGIDCPPDNIRIIGHRRIGSDELWAVEACGTKRELELGLEFPASPGRPMSEAELEEIGQNLKPEPGQEPEEAPMPVISYELLQAAQAKAGHFCMLAPAGVATVGISNQTVEEQQACVQRLQTMVAPLGSERDELGVTRYWFRVGAWAFPTFISFHAPACSRLTLTDTPEYCACALAAGRVASCSPSSIASAAQPGADAPGNARSRDEDTLRRAAPSSRIRFYARAGLGFGSMRSSGDDVPTSDTLCVVSDIWGGVLPNPRLALGVGLAFYEGMSEDTVEYSRDGDLTFIEGTAHLRPRMMVPAAFVSGMPFPFPLRLDGEAGLGILWRASPRADAGRSQSAGLYVAGGLAWEVSGDYVDVGISAKAFLSNTDDGKDSFSTSGFGLTLGLGTHPLREKVQNSEEE